VAAETLGRAGPTADAIDAVQCKRLSAQNKPTRKGDFSSRRRRSLIPQPPEALGSSEILAAGARVSGQANFAELWDCPLVVGDLINNNMNTNWCPHV
jgi:hypothetical protein